MAKNMAFPHAQLVLDTLRGADAFEGLRPQPVDIEVIPNFTGAPDRIQAWLIFESREAHSRAEDAAAQLTSRAKSALINAGFPVDSIGSLAFHLTSLPEIEDGGGRFAFFR